MPQFEHLMRVRAFDGAAFLPTEGESISPRSKVGDYRIEDRGYETPCWIWQRHKDHAGYGKLSPGTAAGDQRAHREYFRLAHGPIPTGAHVHHRCEQTSCVNPAHLEIHSHSAHLAMHKQADSVLSWDDVREMRRLWATGDWTSEQLGDRFGVEKSMAWRIVDGRNWKDPDYEPGIARSCDYCGGGFIARDRRQRFCSTEHRYADRRAA